MLAELCGHGNGALRDGAWNVAEEAFSTFADVVIDDVLWSSVGKLMRTARSRTQLLPVDADDSVPDTSMDDSGYMSWVNWELFVQDVGNLSERDTLEASLGGWLCGTR